MGLKKVWAGKGQNIGRKLQLMIEAWNVYHLSEIIFKKYFELEPSWHLLIFRKILRSFKAKQNELSDKDDSQTTLGVRVNEHGQRSGWMDYLYCGRRITGLGIYQHSAMYRSGMECFRLWVTKAFNIICNLYIFWKAFVGDPKEM